MYKKTKNKKYKIESLKPVSKYELGNQKVSYDKLKPVFLFEDFIKNSRFYTKEHSNSDKNSLLNFLNAISDISSLTWGYMKEKPNQFHAHGIEDDVANFPELNSFDDNIPFFQFKLPNHDKGRFVGYFDDKAIFHIVLYDRNHEFYKRK